MRPFSLNDPRSLRAAVPGLFGRKAAVMEAQTPPSLRICPSNLSVFVPPFFLAHSLSPRIDRLFSARDGDVLRDAGRGRMLWEIHSVNERV